MQEDSANCLRRTEEAPGGVRGVSRGDGGNARAIEQVSRQRTASGAFGKGQDAAHLICLPSIDSDLYLTTRARHRSPKQQVHIHDYLTPFPSVDKLEIAWSFKLANSPLALPPCGPVNGPSHPLTSLSLYMEERCSGRRSSDLVPVPIADEMSDVLGHFNLPCLKTLNVELELGKYDFANTEACWDVLVKRFSNIHRFPTLKSLEIQLKFGVTARSRIDYWVRYGVVCCPFADVGPKDQGAKDQQRYLAIPSSQGSRNRHGLLRRINLDQPKRPFCTARRRLDRVRKQVPPQRRRYQQNHQRHQSRPSRAGAVHARGLRVP